MEKPYVSSIVNKYGDTDRVQADVKTLNEIFDRQGSSLFIDVIAEKVASHWLKFDLENVGVQRAVDSLVNELREAIGERT